MHTNQDALLQWDRAVTAMMQDHMLKAVSRIAREANDRLIQAEIEELYYQLTGQRLDPSLRRDELWAIINAVYHARRLHDMEESCHECPETTHTSPMSPPVWINPHSTEPPTPGSRSTPGGGS